MNKQVFDIIYIISFLIMLWSFIGSKHNRDIIRYGKMPDKPFIVDLLFMAFVPQMILVITLFCIITSIIYRTKEPYAILKEYIRWQK